MKKYREQMQQQLDKMSATGKLFQSEVTGRDIWDTYLGSFDDDPQFRDPDSTTHNCNHCNNFIRRYGNVVAIDENYEIITLFDFDPESVEFTPVNIALSELISSAKIKNVFFETIEELNSLPYEAIKKNQTSFKLGIDKNVKRYTKEEAELYGVVKPNELRTFEHMSLQLAKEFVKTRAGSIESIQATYRDAKNVFQRSMEEIPADTFDLVKDLINQNSLLNGTTYVSKVAAMLEYAKVYANVSAVDSDNWCWVNSYDNNLAKFKNSLIGVLCSELAEGMELNKACDNWNFREDPMNKQKPTAPITSKQIKEAKIFVDDNGYTSSFNRRPATIDDILANEILHLNSDGGSASKDVHIFDAVKSSKSTRHKRSEFDKVEEVSIDTFMYSILPTCTSVEAFLTNEQEDNMMTLTTAEDKGSKQIFKWNNNFSWTFKGNLAGKSMIKNSVKQLGGKVDGILRFSIMWAPEGSSDNSDLDAHCKESPGEHIYYSHKVSAKTGGNLDIDIIDPNEHKRSTKKNVVENITFPNYPYEGQKFEFYVKNYSNRGSRGFQAEIEYKGIQFQYEHIGNIPTGRNVKVADVTYKDGKFEIKHHLTPTDGYGVEKEFYNIKTGHFHKVNLVSLSPNHWGENEIGNKYYFFFLEGAQAQTSIRSFHNENLKGDLIVHRKVMEVLANTTMIDSATNELTGLGFNSTVKDELVLRLTGSHKRVIKVKF